ncbi:hypothetical protein M422DRAFT_247589 [Sphaerobolus stellatus SS14]|nr:hypothetical protein M422DRAFT_247589 [Sphaerobolus stellatus SS14]
MVRKSEEIPHPDTKDYQGPPTRLALLLRTLVCVAVAFPVNESLVGLSEPEINSFITSNGVVTIPNLPGQLAKGQDGLKPDQIFTAAREGLNFANDFAKFLTYQAFLMNGNSITNLMSLALKSSLTGPDPTRPAYVGGLSQHGTFEVAELRHNRLVDSIKNNPQLEFTSPLILSAYSKAIFPIIFFIDGHLNNRRLTTDGARRFFELQYMPADFHRQPSPINFTVIELLVGQISVRAWC